MKWTNWTGATLHFSKPERVAILLLLGLTAFLYLLPRFFAVTHPAPVSDTAWIAAMKQLEIQEERAEKSRTRNWDPPQKEVYDRPPEKGTLFYFDPNTLATEGWRQLGLREKTIQTIQRFRDRGGRFRQAADLQKIYGLFPDEYERLAPWVRIADTEAVASNKTEWSPEKRPASVKPAYRIIDINLADTTEFIALPGIGTKLAARIVLFREKLGGFYRVEQIGETFGLADSVYQKIKPWLKLEPFRLRILNINTATEEELKNHPYLRWKIARLIIAYRNEHGPFASVEALRNIMAIDEALLEKIKPYLEI